MKRKVVLRWEMKEREKSKKNGNFSEKSKKEAERKKQKKKNERNTELIFQQCCDGLELDMFQFEHIKMYDQLNFLLS